MKKINGRRDREIARRTRDNQWEFMADVQRFGILHVCTWNKNRRLSQKNERRFCLMDWMDIAAWMRAHRAWFRTGPWDHSRDTFPVALTRAGRAALRRRAVRHDREPVTGGLVEPGHVTAMHFHYQRPLWEMQQLRDPLHGERSRLRENWGLTPEWRRAA